jgi:DNA-binding NarL/FixJ family response regulator
MCPVRLLIADDHEVVRRGLRALLQEQSGWQVVAEATNGSDAVAKADEFLPDVAILDITMPSLNGLDAAKRISKLRHDTKILILTMHESDRLIQSALDAGASGYLNKTDAGRNLVMAVKALLSNRTFFTPNVAQRLTDGLLGNGRKTPATRRSELTGREREIVQLLAEGKGSKEMATLLGLSVKTVETHRSNILRKLNCHSVTALVRYAVHNHLIEA